MKFTTHIAALSICATVLAQAGAPADPVCGRPSSFDLVRSIRMKLAAERKGLSALQAELPPSLAIKRGNGLNLPQLLFSGTPGKGYEVEAAPTLTGSNWRSVLSVSMGDEALTWTPDIPAAMQFYRLRAGEPDGWGDSASNFRLLDHLGTARDLYYHSHLSALVVVSAGKELAEITPLTPTLDSLATTYSNRVQTWILLQDSTLSRSDLAARVKALGIRQPVLVDGEGIAARSIGLTRAGEVAVVRPPGFDIPYRGAVAGASQTAPADTYLGQALANIFSTRPIAFRRTLAAGSILPSSELSPPNYSTDVAPILYQYCANCHRPNTAAPFALTNYTVIQEWAAGMKHQVLSRQMPPWHADPAYGQFSNDISLPEAARSTLVRWLDAGAPRGTGNDPLAEWPIRTEYDQIPEELGDPDQVVTIPRQEIKATGVEPYRYIFVQTTNTTEVYLKAAIIRHTAYRAVHHSLVWLDKVGNSGIKDNSTYIPYIAEHFPGYKPYIIPTNSYLLLNQSNWLTFNLHYNTLNVATNDQPVLYLWYHKTKPPRTFVTQMVANANFAIRPGAADYVVQADWTFNTAISLFRLNPHMHFRGKRMKAEAIYPNGKREVLLSVPDYDFNWQIGYQFAEPKVLPAGTRVNVIGAFDNSPQNLANPDPTATVRWGDQSSSEMFVLFFEYLQ